MIHISFDVPSEPPSLIVTERIRQPLERVWLAQTEALYIQRWWGPEGYRNVTAEVNATVGGPWRVIQRDPEGNEYAFYGKFEDVVPQERLVLSLTAEIFPDVPLTITQEFTASDKGTIVVSTYEFPGDFERDGYLALGGLERLREASRRLNALLRDLAA